MGILKSTLRIWILPVFLLAGSCTNDPEEGGKPATGAKPSFGSFTVLLKPSEGYSQVSGQLYDGVMPSAALWNEAGKIGECRLLKPKIPFCATPCGSEAICVDNDKCEAFAKEVTAGTVGVTGLKTTSGAVSFSMDPINEAYQPAAGTTVAFPPFAEGDLVKVTAAGNSTFAGFTLSAPGISPLTVLNDTIRLADGKPINLTWTAPKNPGASRVSVTVNISHHGGTRGEIQCEVPDMGALEIPASLLDQLKALGVSGFPAIEVVRKSVGSHAAFDLDLVLEDIVTKSLVIPGLISCETSLDCPEGQTCLKPDSMCK